MPTRVRYDCVPLTVPATEMRLSVPSAALNLVSLVPRDTFSDSRTSCKCKQMAQRICREHVAWVNSNST